MRAADVVGVLGVLVLASSPLGCSRQRSAADVCAALKAKGLADKCTPVPPKGITADAVDVAGFNVPTENIPGGPGGKGGTVAKGLVLSFDSAAKREKTFAALQKANPRSYIKGRSEKDLFFILCDSNDGALGRRMTSFLAGDD